MGTFAEIFKETGSIIPEDKRNEFVEKIEKLFRAGGMMDMEWIQLYGKKIPMLRKVSMQEDGMEFFYNYFEDDSWETAGFNRKDCYVWSNKIGWRHFHQTIIAAYVLEELYTEGISAAMVNGDPIFSWSYVGWINYLFHEQNHIKNFDPWKLFEAVHCSKEERVEYMEWYDIADKRYAFIGGCEIYAVQHGYEKAIAVYGAREKGELEKLAFEAMQNVVKTLKSYVNNCEKEKESQLHILMEILRVYYEKDKKAVDSLPDGDEMLVDFLMSVSISDAPAFAVKVISEIYEVDFWTLWEKIRDVVKRKHENIYGNEGYYVVPISTEKFLGQSPDDMIPYWEEGCELEFSEELQDWFENLKEQYDDLLDTEFLIDNVLKYIVDLLQEVNENYYRIFAFSDFFEETLENLCDKRYRTLWRIFDNMIHDPEMKKAGDVIFVPDGPEYEKEGLHYWGEQPKRRLIGCWDIMEPDKKYNKARVTFRRYMALMSNKGLRHKVFGF